MSPLMLKAQRITGDFLISSLSWKTKEAVFCCQKKKNCTARLEEIVLDLVYTPWPCKDRLLTILLRCEDEHALLTQALQWLFAETAFPVICSSGQG